MKYWRGYLTAAVIAFFTWAMTEFSRTHTALVDMIYPFITRSVQNFLAEWSSSVAFCVWQVFVIALIVGLLATIVLMIVFRWNFIQWLGWVLASASLLFFVHTGVYGLNGYAGDLAEDIRLEQAEYSLAELEEATVYYRDLANTLAGKVNRDAAGNVEFSSFQDLAQQAGEGFDTLVYEHSCPIFAGSTLPVKELGWADMYTSMGITGFTMSLTGEAAVNPQIPDVSLPFTMCHEMAHRMCVANERDANFAAYLACRVNSSEEFQYSAYFMAYRYCYTALCNVGATAAAGRVSSGANQYLQYDMATYSAFFSDHQDAAATNLANTVNDAYLKAGGVEEGIASYGEVCDLLVSWHIQEIVLPMMQDEEVKFDPTDETQVDLTGIVNAKKNDG